jgi:pSer/pThr/pTyr-binding forkhead associated (FHA) protein
VVASEPGKGTVYVLAATTKIGRIPEGNDIALSNDSYVSGAHAVITQEGGDFFIEDRGSTNGTYKLLRQKTKIEPGDVVKIGDTNLEFQP